MRLNISIDTESEIQLIDNEIALVNLCIQILKGNRSGRLDYTDIYGDDIIGLWRLTVENREILFDANCILQY